MKKFLFIYIFLFTLSCTETIVEDNSGKLGHECKTDKICDIGLSCNSENICVTEDINLCKNITCSNHGVCKVINNQTSCNCEEGYYSDGNFCRVIDLCKDVDCSNHGSCIVENNYPKCNCEEGYHTLDLYCITDNNPCSGVTCDNWKECNTNSGDCELKTGMCDTTSDCNDNNLVCDTHSCINPCDTENCSNHGVCSVENSSPICDCDIAYGGDSCSSCATGYHEDGANCIIDDNNPCSGVTCDNWKECNPNSGDCELKTGMCDTTSDCNDNNLVCDTHNCTNPCDTENCSNHGVCSVENSSPVCDCDIAYRGDICSNCATGYHLDGGVCIIDNNDPCSGVTCDSWKECNTSSGDCELKTGMCDTTSDCNDNNLVCDAHSCTNPCDTENCSNHGVCSVENSSPVCDCYEGYYLNGLDCLIIPISKIFLPNGLRLDMGERVNLRESSLRMQYDGNLVLYDNDSALWETDTNTGCSNCGYYFKFQADGNLVVYNDENSGIWHSATYREGVHHLLIDNEKLALYDNYSNIIWNSICTDGNLDSNARCTLGPGGNKITDSKFKLINYNIDNQNIHGGGTFISPNWIFKTNDDNLIVSTSNISDGVQVDANYSSTLGYLYVRQIIPNVFQFENKTITIEVEYTNNSGQNLLYDVYIQARFNPDNTTRVLVADTPAYTFKTGSNIVKHTFNVPDFGNRVMENTEGLSVAFRVIAQNKTANFKIHAYRVIIHGN